MTDATSSAGGPVGSFITGLVNDLTSFIGNADVQKGLGVLQTALAGSTGVEGKSLGAHVAGMTIGSAFTLGVHLVDALRAKIGR